MKTRRLLARICIVTASALLAGCGTTEREKAPAPVEIPAATPLAPDTDATDGAIRFLEERAKSDPLDFIARNKLAGYYLQKLRETGGLSYLELAGRAARESLAAIPAEQNVGGLATLAQVEYASHEFVSARDHAVQLRTYDPNKLYPFLTLGDSMLELGDYDGATKVYHEIEGRSGDTDSDRLNAETRLARLALLEGHPDAAEQDFARALAAALRLNPVPRETVAWCYWQLGETAFSIGDYERADQRYNEALTTFPDYYRALASLGRVRAARGDTAAAIGFYERATRILPDPSFIAALGDLYTLAGRDRDAAAQYGLVEQIGRLSQFNGVLYNRQLALYWADHDLNPEAAYANAAKEYETRRDIYGADAVAWTALKAQHLPEALAASKDALRLNTKDARLLYHAGMIAKASGDAAAARTYLDRALTLSPQFDPLQAPIARAALDAIAQGH